MTVKVRRRSDEEHQQRKPDENLILKGFQDAAIKRRDRRRPNPSPAANALHVLQVQEQDLRE